MANMQLLKRKINQKASYISFKAFENKYIPFPFLVAKQMTNFPILPQLKRNTISSKHFQLSQNFAIVIDIVKNIYATVSDKSVHFKKILNVANTIPLQCSVEILLVQLCMYWLKTSLDPWWEGLQEVEGRKGCETCPFQPLRRKLLLLIRTIDSKELFSNEKNPNLYF